MSVYTALLVLVALVGTASLVAAGRRRFRRHGTRPANLPSAQLAALLRRQRPRGA